MIYGFTFEQVMRLSSVRRWGIIEMSKGQSVAEHSYNVSMISLAILNQIGVIVPNINMVELQNLTLKAMTWALIHDLPEILTGDIPTPVKVSLSDQIDIMEQKEFPLHSHFKSVMKGTLALGIVKIADYIDAIQFAERFCIDPRKYDIIKEMRGKLNTLAFDLSQKENVPVMQAVENLWRD